MRALGALGPEAVSACAALCEVCLRGGKRLRATLVSAGARCMGNRYDEKLLTDIGAAVELLHAYFLVHDDWIDGDLVRRGGPSAHAILRQLHGDSAGDAAAILAGDWGAALANDWMDRLPLPPRTLVSLLSKFTGMQKAAIGGQMRDVIAKDGDIEQTYILKTASYTVEGPLALGAIVNGATAKDLVAIRKFSRPIGIAFQLRDDLLGLFGAPSDTGKPFGSDLRAGKHTVVVVLALERARGADRNIIKAVFGNPRASQRQLRAAVQAIESAGARHQVEERIVSLLHTASRQLRLAPITEDGRALLASAASALVLRSV